MDVFEAIRRRHSYRGPFTPAPVPREDLRTIVQAGLQAPSGCNAQTTSFVIVDEPDTVQAIARIVEKEQAAQAFIVCLVDERPVYKGMAFPKEDCAAAVENILLAVTALGYATVWLDGMLRTEGRAAQVAALLGVPDNLTVQIVLPIGVPAKAWTQKEKQPFAQRAWFNRYGG